MIISGEMPVLMSCNELFTFVQNDNCILPYIFYFVKIGILGGT